MSLEIEFFFTKKYQFCYPFDEFLDSLKPSFALSLKADQLVNIEFLYFLAFQYLLTSAFWMIADVSV